MSRALAAPDSASSDQVHEQSSINEDNVPFIEKLTTSENPLEGLPFQTSLPSVTDYPSSEEWHQDMLHFTLMVDKSDVMPITATKSVKISGSEIRNSIALGRGIIQPTAKMTSVTSKKHTNQPGAR